MNPVPDHVGTQFPDEPKNSRESCTSPVSSDRITPSMLNYSEARELVVSQLAYEFHAPNASELITDETERVWGWLFLYEAFSGGPPCGWFVKRKDGAMKHLPAVSSVNEAIEEFEKTLGR
jgi:hypothetical protein